MASEDKKFELDERLLEDKEIKVLAMFLRGVMAAASELDSEDHEDDEDVDEVIGIAIEQFKEKKEIYNSNVDRIIKQLEKARKVKDDKAV